MTEASTLSDRVTKLIHAVKTLEPTDREQLTSRLQETGYGPFAVEKSLQRLTALGYLRSDYRVAHHVRAERGEARKRVAYFLGPKGKALFGYSPDQLRTKRNRLRLMEGHDGWNLHHNLGVSRFRCYLLNAQDRGLCTFKSKHIGTEFEAGDRKHRPDYLLVINEFPVYFEYERRNKLSKTVRHARRYWRAWNEHVINDPVVFVTQHPDHLEDIRQAIWEELGDTGNYFRFLSEEDYDLFNPNPALLARIVEPVLP